MSIYKILDSETDPPSNVPLLVEKEEERGRVRVRVHCAVKFLELKSLQKLVSSAKVPRGTQAHRFNSAE